MVPSRVPFARLFRRVNVKDLSGVKTLDIAQLNDSDLQELLFAKGQLQQQLFAMARQVRREMIGDKVRMRGVIEISSFCQKKCRYCAMNCSNPRLDRYRLEPDKILEIARHIHEAGIRTVFLQSGQDPGSEAALEYVIPIIKKELGTEILLCVGEKSHEEYLRLAQLGADSYILKFETSDPKLYEEIACVPPDKRLQCIRWIQEAGLKLGTGNIVGLPKQTTQTLLEDIRLALRIKPDFVSCAPFIPNQGTPYENSPIGDLDVTFNTMAIWRIALKNCLIPTVSALEKLRPGGQLMGLNAGANVITINFTPQTCRERYAIYSKQRFVVSLEHALNTIKQAGMSIMDA